MVGTLANPLNNLEQAYKSGTKLAPLAESHHSPGGRNLQENPVSNLELKRPTAAICITLLAALCCKQTLADQGNLLIAFLYQL